MSHRHPHHEDAGPTVAAFLTPMVGRRVAVIRDNHENVTGQLDGIEGDPDHPSLVVSGVAVDVTDCTRIKLHFHPDNPPRRRR